MAFTQRAERNRNISLFKQIDALISDKISHEVLSACLPGKSMEDMSSSDLTDYIEMCARAHLCREHAIHEQNANSQDKGR